VILHELPANEKKISLEILAKLLSIVGLPEGFNSRYVAEQILGSTTFLRTDAFLTTLGIASVQVSYIQQQRMHSSSDLPVCGRLVTVLLRTPGLSYYERGDTIDWASLPEDLQDKIKQTRNKSVMYESP
jgi:hypothetical protein